MNIIKSFFNRFVLYVVISVSVFLYGCASITSDFECPKTGGITCKRIDQINDLYDRSLVTKKEGEELVIERDRKRTSFFKRFLKFRSNQTQTKGLHEGLHSKQTVLHVWIASFEDVDGNYHQQHDIDTIVDAGHRLETPISEAERT
jgi:conjugal transfer pilus assembly protein TraV